MLNQLLHHRGASNSSFYYQTLTLWMTKILYLKIVVENKIFMVGKVHQHQRFCESCRLKSRISKPWLFQTLFLASPCDDHCSLTPLKNVRELKQKKGNTWWSQSEKLAYPKGCGLCFFTLILANFFFFFFFCNFLENFCLCTEKSIIGAEVNIGLCSGSKGVNIFSWNKFRVSLILSFNVLGCVDVLTCVA